MRLAIRRGSTVLEPHRVAHPEIPGLEEYHRDLLRSFGQDLDPAAAANPPAVTHADLVEQLLDGDPLGPVVPDLVLVAYALPDVHPFTTTATHANWRLGNHAASFAVSEQGLAAPFSAVRIADAYFRAGRCSAAVLAVLEQTTLPNQDPLVDKENLVDSGALLLLSAEDDGLPALGVEQIWTQRQPAACARRLAAAVGEPGATLVVEGPWALDHGVSGAGVTVDRLGTRTYGTSVWLALAEHREWAQRYDTVVLHDTDPRSDCCAAVVLRSSREETPGS
ncbi:hypothetical protein FHX82_005602 [Amycolatopsis bartoniae]|uniref:Uncharacterized protein n=1 Tax=Amycolatopsis bartoniae TaxID=941986 RepID=A0A8H9J3R3_9PSEU|nr:hypothetical protein [Amycolatopsis bartoniae]MBB2938524.1 hypothetical protein [Amycolatopsis bartoniae]TVT10335.1 hypothetical protein FNH07_05420 [Amycolatopsis bartoniae]GHF70390.1 hypothetical protein GCM10017566_50210 [Amycolatopsis bartoniae]